MDDDVDTVVVITFNEDGDLPSVEEMSKEKFKKMVKECHEDGERLVFHDPKRRLDVESFVGMVVIEGKIIKPKAVKVTTEYDV